MKIHSFSKVLAVIVAIPLLVFMYYTFDGRSQWAVYGLVPSLICLVAIYVGHGEIDYWWIKRHPLTLDKPLLDWLQQYDLFYKGLSQDEKTRFETRLVLYMEARMFKSVGSEHHDVPHDIKAIISGQAVRMSFYQKDHLIGDYDRLFLYKHPFPTPQKQFLHTVETEHEDGVIILSIEHAIPAIVNNGSLYNITMHAFAEAFTKVHQRFDWPDGKIEDWMAVSNVLGMNKEKIESTIGYQQKDILPVLIVAYFHDRQNFQQYLAEYYDQFEVIFNNPTRLK